MRRRTGVLICGLGAVLLATGSTYIWLAGSVIVRDPAGEAQRVEVIDGWGNTQELSRFGRSYVLLRPEIEGAVRVRCRSGQVVDGGYVTGGPLHTRLSLDGTGRCSFT